MAWASKKEGDRVGVGHLSPSFPLAQAIFESSLFSPMNYPYIS